VKICSFRLPALSSLPLHIPPKCSINLSVIAFLGRGLRFEPSDQPPCSLKSLVSSVAFPAFVLGHDPTERLIAVSYGSDLAIRRANDFRAVGNAPFYRRLFPQTRISRTKNTESEVSTAWDGYRLATSIDAALTGRGGNIVIIDDPLKPNDAFSDSEREGVNNWFSNTLLSRLDDKRTGAVVVVMQRLHMDDLAGTLLRSSDESTLLNLPAIAEQEENIQVDEDKISSAPCWRSAPLRARA
jgi:hypothetical protein